MVDLDKIKNMGAELLKVSQSQMNELQSLIQNPNIPKELKDDIDLHVRNAEEKIKELKDLTNGH